MNRVPDVCWLTALFDYVVLNGWHTEPTYFYYPYRWVANVANVYAGWFDICIGRLSSFLEGDGLNQQSTHT